MNSKIFTFIVSIIAGVGLLIGGGYLVINNYLNPQGLMFEGIVFSALGIILILMVTIALSIGETIMIFGKIMEQQVNIQREMREMANITKGRGGIDSILSNLLPGASSISITDLESGETKSSDLDIPIDIDAIRKLMSNSRPLKPSGKSSLGDMNLEQLEKELAKAIKSDNYEKAEEINKAIKVLKNKDDENNSDNL